MVNWGRVRPGEHVHVVLSTIEQGLVQFCSSLYFLGRWGFDLIMAWYFMESSSPNFSARVNWEGVRPGECVHVVAKYY